MDEHPDHGSPHSDVDWIKDRVEIAALQNSYGHAVDMLSSDPEGGRRILRTVFTEDAVIDAYFVNQDLDTKPASTSMGPDRFVDAVLHMFSGMGYTATNHHMGNMQISVHGDTASMRSCTTAPHVIDWGRRIEYITASYTDHVVRTPQGWRIARRKLQGTSHVPLESPSHPGARTAADTLAKTTPPAHASGATGPGPQGPQPGGFGSPIDTTSLEDRWEIEALAVRYAFAADAGVSGNVAEGRRLIEDCFTEDAVFEGYLPGTDPSGPPDFRHLGPDAWSDAGAALRYRAAQHHMGNVHVEMSGDTAMMKCCVTVTHVNAWDRSIDLFTGYYTDRIVRTPKGFRIAHKRLHATSFIRLEAPPAGELEQPLDAGIKAAASAPCPTVPADPVRSDEGAIGDSGMWRDRMEIGALAVSYAYAADAMGRGDVEEGRRIIESCFTEDAVFELRMPSDDPDAPPAITWIGPHMWAERVPEGFAQLGFTATQHHVGNVLISLQRGTAIMKCCLTATHVIDWSSSIVYATGIYTDHVVRTARGWRIARRRFDTTSALRLQSPPRSGGEAPTDTLRRVLSR
jgi:hypothetical protein